MGLSGISFCTIFTLAMCVGAVIYTHYSKLGCGPLEAGVIYTANQVRNLLFLALCPFINYTNKLALLCTGNILAVYLLGYHLKVKFWMYVGVILCPEFLV